MNIWRLIEIIILFGLLSSCDPTNCNNTIIENDTKGSLNIVLYSTNQGELKTKFFSAGSKEQINIFHECGTGIMDDVFPQDLGIDSIRFDFPGILTITFTKDIPGKNPLNRDDWIQSTRKKCYRGQTVNNIFEITDEDLSAWQ